MATSALGDSLFATLALDDSLFATSALDDSLFATSVLDDSLFGMTLQLLHTPRLPCLLNPIREAGDRDTGFMPGFSHDFTL